MDNTANMCEATPRNTRTLQGKVGRFLAIGGGSACVQFGILAILQGGLKPGLAFSISFFASTAFHYCCNRFWTFRSDRQDTLLQLGEYLLTVAISYGLNIGVFFLCRDMLGWDTMLSAIAAMPAASVVVFFLLNIRVFKSTESTEEPQQD